MSQMKNENKTPSVLRSKNKHALFLKFSAFWIFMILYKFGGGLHYSLIAPLGEAILPLWLVGLLMGGTSIIQLLLDVPAGHLLDRFGYLKLLKVTTFIFLFAGISLLFNFTLITYLISLFAASFGWLFFGPGVSAYILSNAPKAAAGKFMSFRDTFGSIGVVLSSVTLGFVIKLDPKIIGVIILALLFLALISLFFSPKDTVSVHAEQKIPTQNHYIRRHPLHRVLGVMNKLNPASSMLVLLGFAASTFYGVVWFTVPLVIAHQTNSGLNGLSLGVFDLSIVMLGFILGNLADKWNKRTLVFVGLLLFSITGTLLGFNLSWLFIIYGFLATTGDEMASISLWSWLHSLDHQHAHDGLIAGVISLFEDLGWAIGPIFAGLLYGIIGPSYTIACAGIILFLTWIIYQFLMKHHKKAPAGLIIPPKPMRRSHRI